jgi:hypothetical protein
MAEEIWSWVYQRIRKEKARGTKERRDNMKVTENGKDNDRS